MKDLSLTKLKEHIIENHPAEICHKPNKKDGEAKLDHLHPKLPMCISTDLIDKNPENLDHM